MKYYESELPGGYREALVIDASTKKFTILANVVALMIMTAGIVPAMIVFKPLLGGEDYTTWRYLVFMVSMLVYIVLHELVHGVAYWLTTRQKLSFGLTASVAYCGVPNIYVYRKAALISLLAPFTVFDIVFLLGAFLLPTQADRFYSLVLLSVHIGGCVGDLYDTLLYLFRFRDNSTLMRDTGPKQTFYIKEE